MKKLKTKVILAVVLILLLGIYYYTALPAINIHATEFWVFLTILIILAAAFFVKKKDLNRYEIKNSKGLKVILGLLAAVVIVYLAGTLLSSLRGTRRHHTVLAAVPDQTENLPPPAAAPEAMRRVFSLLCESDPAFATEATYLLWLSDLTRRKNCGRAQVYLLDDDATACLSAVSPRYAYLSMVAVAPGARRAGLGSRLLRAVLADCAARSLIVLTAAQDDALLPFYRSAGFDVQPDPLVSLTLFPSHHHKESDR